MPIHNPRLRPRADSAVDPGVRHELADRLLTRLGEPETPHLLVVGDRGMGKTTLLRWLGNRVTEEAALRLRWLPLELPEESFDVDRLSVFWTHALASAVDVLAARGESVRVLREALAELPKLSELQRTQRARSVLVDLANRRGVRLLLLIDNLDRLLDRLKDHQWSLRSAVSEEMLLVGTSTRVLTVTRAYDAAFYDYFEVERLEGLSALDAQRLVSGLGSADVAALVEAHPERLEPIRMLVGGNPRSLALLATLLSADGDVRSDLELVLDRLTPHFHARLSQRSLQSQKVAHTLAMHWHPVDSARLSKMAEMASRTVTGQLERLHQAGMVDKVLLADGRGRLSRQGYQLSDRVMNLWLLMSTRSQRGRLAGLVAFSRALHVSGTLGAAQGHESAVEPLQALRDRLVRGLGDADLWCALGERLLQGEPAQAEEAFRNALAIDPDAPRANAGMARALHKLDRDEDALWNARAAGEGGPEGQLALACCLVSLDRAEEAWLSVRSVLVHTDESLHIQLWPELLHVFAMMVKQSQATTAAAWLDDSGVLDRWLPLRAALQVTIAGTEEVLLAYAPEVRAAAESVLVGLRAG